MGSEGQNVSRGKWMALAAALLGWMFDGAEMGVFSMVGRPAVLDLLRTTDEGKVRLWFSIIIAGFLVGAATGGVLFGWLGDRIGRVRAMTFSVIVYSVFTGLCGFVAEPWQLGVLRFVAALGMGGEWALGVALVMEVWPNRSRAFMAGLIGAAGNVGYMLVGIIGIGLNVLIGGLGRALLSAGLSQEIVEQATRNDGWRLMMVFGTLPALLTFFIRLFVPESERWKEEKARGSTTGWATRDLLGVVGGALGPALIVYLWAWDGPEWLPHSLMLRLAGSVIGMAIAVIGYTYPMIRFLQRQAGAMTGVHAWRPTLRRMLLAACLSGVALLGTWGSTQSAPSWADKISEKGLHAKEYTQIALAIGAIVGTLLAAFAGDWIGRRKAYALLCVLSLGSVYIFYQGNSSYGPAFLGSAVLIGGTTASFYGWLPLYLPELFATRVRATGQGFGFNFGRIIAAVGTLQIHALVAQNIRIGTFELPAGYPSVSCVVSLIYLVGMAIIWLAPETRGKPLPE
jgi:MFS transporter, SHS family, sialic acid transporter